MSRRALSMTPLPTPFFPPGDGRGRLLAYEVLVGATRSDPVEELAQAGEFEHASLATGFARAGRWQDFDRVMALSTPRDWGRDGAVFGLPCYFPANRPDDLAQAMMRECQYFLTRMNEETSERERQSLPQRLLQSARCLRETGDARAALNIVELIADPAERFDVLARITADDLSRPPFVAERRMVRAAFGLAERQGLWGHDAVQYLAADAERIGEHRMMERILDNIPTPAGRVEAITQIMQSYCPATGMTFRGIDDCVAVRQ